MQLILSIAFEVFYLKARGYSKRQLTLSKPASPGPFQNHLQNVLPNPTIRLS